MESPILKRGHLLPGLILVAISIAACGDDEEAPWSEVEVVGAPPAGVAYSIAFAGSSGLIGGSGEGGTTTPWVASRSEDGTWAADGEIPLPASGVVSAVGFTTSGEALVSGFELELPPSGYVLDERGGWSRSEILFGGRAFASAPDVVRLAGTSGIGIVLLTSHEPDVWIPEEIPFASSSQNEKGLNDIDFRDGLFVACGFDDGGDGTPESPDNVVFQNSGSGWTAVEAPCGGCSAYEFRSVAVLSSGAFLLGGAVTDFSGGSPDEYTAFLLLRTATEWVELVLPQPGTLDRVNDILVASNGDVFLACGVTSAFVVRKPGTGSFERDATLPTAGIVGLAESSDGSIWAAGSIGDRPALWKRRIP